MNQTDFSVRRLDERLACLTWPNLERIETLEVGGNSCVIVCAGFEDRAIEPIRRICNTNQSRFSVGLVKYQPEVHQNRLDELRAITAKSNIDVTEFTYDREIPSKMGECLCQFSQSFNHVYIDISGMSRLLIVQILAELIKSHHQSITVLYGEADVYPPSEVEYNEDSQGSETQPSLSYLSSGIFEIAATPELGSVSMLGHAIRLIAFPSFDPAQLTNLVQELQPTYTDFFHGVPPHFDNKWRTQAIMELNKQTIDDLHWKYEHMVSTFDYRETLRRLFDIYAKRSMFDRLVVAPTGSKMQSVAVGIFRAQITDVQIVYPTPQVFVEPERYTLGMRQLYQLEVPTSLIEIAIKNN